MRRPVRRFCYFANLFPNIFAHFFFRTLAHCADCAGHFDSVCEKVGEEKRWEKRTMGCIQTFHVAINGCEFVWNDCHTSTEWIPMLFPVKSTACKSDKQRIEILVCSFCSILVNDTRCSQHKYEFVRTRCDTHLSHLQSHSHFRINFFWNSHLIAVILLATNHSNKYDFLFVIWHNR